VGVGAELTMGIRNSDASIVPPKTQVFHYILSLPQPYKHFENISTFLFAPLQLEAKKKNLT